MIRAILDAIDYYIETIGVRGKLCISLFYIGKEKNG